MKLLKEITELNAMETPEFDLPTVDEKPLEKIEVINILIKILKIAQFFTNAKIDRVIDVVIYYLETQKEKVS